jgi:hypothetical protein
MRFFVLVTGVMLLATSSSLAIDIFTEDIFLRGDADGSGVIDKQDSIAIQDYIFVGDFTPTCHDACDANDDGQINMSDSIYLLYFLFQGGQPPPAPGPSTCGADPSSDAITCQSSSCGDYRS